jgi:hypothetical protein
MQVGSYGKECVRLLAQWAFGTKRIFISVSRASKVDRIHNNEIYQQLGGLIKYDSLRWDISAKADVTSN